jgi:isocitrate dehydrogenase kinase/phosphatase
MLSPSMIEAENDTLVIRHSYLERRTIPLNLDLDRATTDELEQAVLEYGNPSATSR